MTQKNPSLVLSTTSFIGTPEARLLDSCEPSRPTVRLFKPSTAYPLCHQRVYVTQGTNLAWRSRVEKDQVMAGLPVVVGLEWCSSLKAWIWSIQLGDGELSMTDWHMCRITNKSKCAEVDVALNLYPMTSMIWWKPNIWSGLEIAPSLEENCYLINAKENGVLKALKKERKKRDSTLQFNSVIPSLCDFFNTVISLLALFLSKVTSNEKTGAQFVAKGILQFVKAALKVEIFKCLVVLLFFSLSAKLKDFK